MVLFWLKATKDTTFQNEPTSLVSYMSFLLLFGDALHLLFYVKRDDVLAQFIKT